jgi:hypothetical protein
VEPERIFEQDKELGAESEINLEVKSGAGVECLIIIVSWS